MASGCTGRWASRAADREVYAIVEQKEAQALGQATGFRIDETTRPLTTGVLAGAPLETALPMPTEPADTPAVAGDADTTATTATVAGLRISLSEALELALDNNRDYQTRKEGVYLAALRLTEARHAFDPIFSGTLEQRWDRQPGPGGAVERFGTTAGNLGLTQLLATGARVSVGLSNQLLRAYSGGGLAASNQTQLGAAVVQPLLRGFGAAVATENLRQSERDVLYAVRDFARYRQGFVINQIELYLRVLQARDAIGNERAALERLTFQRERAEAMEAAERIERFQVDQARQNEFSARNRWLNAQTAYKQQLDRFKVSLGLPLELQLEPDPAELEALRAQGPVALGLDLPAAQAEALTRRRDLLTARDVAADAERKLAVAANSLLPALDARAEAGLGDDGRNQRWLDLDGRTRRYGVGLALELPLDRLAERNDYRAAEIARARAAREAEELRNSVLSQVRSASFSAEEARDSYEIQVAAEELARRRVENVRLLLEVGRVGISIRDQLEAESALRDTQNAITRALIDYTLARLRFYDTIERLEIDEQGAPHGPTELAQQ